MEEEQQTGVVSNIVQFLSDSMRKIDALMIPVIDDEDICGIPEFLEEGIKRKIGELKNESITWNIGGQIMIIDYDEDLVRLLKENDIKFITFDEVTEKNFDIIKGRIKNAIIGEILSITKEEEAPPFTLPKVGGSSK